MKSLSDTIEGLRTEFTRSVLDKAHLAPDPVVQFGAWLDQAIRADVHEPNAMTLATCNAAGRPTARIVLCRGFDTRGFVFFTNYNSRKGQDLAENNAASLNFFWPELQRQLRIDGHVAKLTAEESDAYFASRPRGSQLGAWASMQSQVIASRAVLETDFKSEMDRFQKLDVERPPYWGGYRLAPASIEFWQGRESRLHDRLRYRREDGAWIIERLSP